MGILIPDGLHPAEAAPVFIEGILGGSVATLGMTAAGALISPEIGTSMAIMSLTAIGFVTSFVLQAKKAAKKKR